ncbi:Nucleoside-diphosphate-sugar epimerase [Halalkaliarchaeum sp. AArc-CO]|uniref:NAD-dependent epimerase/dehydratase family protein n=1 Tax=unclassified Halalkaliarchaeum TaxID=2678344 RepID=UPI00217CF298|nr:MULTISPECIES: NAD-dependent epimerase/dehydratase family protein [unclassified Halalkaliarchaeum]MDR5672526.1 NAD-dependent epimerase/dehydratase family protein [Halalkaliarchaeum sp. AArc-GB]UWG50524.1 Nucleoside-diphosphate-sugar epimerase [Halalkaliarchaeum sp. AArc-CO]
MENARVLVTGGAGFIGSVLANRLAPRNDVLVVDDLSLGTTDNLVDDVEFLEASVLDPDLTDTVRDRLGGVDALFVFAALSSRDMHDEEPQRGVRVNVEGFVNSVEVARDLGCETVVYASSSSVYGTRERPSPESLSVRPRTRYEASKLAREQYASAYAEENCSVTGLRYFSVYQGFGGNEAHKGGYANTVSQFADAIARGESPVVFGDGTQTRDFLHVEDAVRATELVADQRLSGIYNVGTGEAYSFNEMIDLFNGAFGTDVEPEYIDVPYDDYVYHTRADPSKLEAATGWEPRIDFETGIERVCRPYLE